MLGGGGVWMKCWANCGGNVPRGGYGGAGGRAVHCKMIFYDFYQIKSTCLT